MKKGGLGFSFLEKSDSQNQERQQFKQGKGDKGK